MASRKIEDCVPELQEKYKLLKEKANEVGIDFIITCTARDMLEQFALYAQGRQDLNTVNHLRDNVGLAPIGEFENRHVVTWTVDSKHIINGKKRTASEAFDVAMVKDGNKIHYDLKIDVNGNNMPDYIELARIGKEVGLVCGAFWKKPDYVHFEI